MANVFLKDATIAAQGIGLLQREIVLPNYAVRFGPAEFVGAQDDTINYRIPSLLVGRDYEFRTRAAKIVVDELSETKIAIALDRHAYSAVAITDEELTLDIDSWGDQVARPQVSAVAQKLEGYLAEAMQVTADYANTVDYAQGDPDNTNDRSFLRAALAANKALNDEHVPKVGRVMLVGSEVEQAALLSPHLTDVDRAGDDSALREAVIGRIAGFTVVASTSVPSDFAVAFHPTAFALANVAPIVPAGAAAGATINDNGLNMRWIRDYESDFLRDRSVYSAFAGASHVKDQRDLREEVGGNPNPAFGDLTGKNARAVLVNFTPFVAVP